MFENIDANQLEAMRAQREVLLVDVRTDAEVARGMIAGARHIPLFSLPQRASEFIDAGAIVIYCQSGGRSAQACTYLAQQGISSLHNLSGGILGWMREGKPIAEGPVNS